MRSANSAGKTLEIPEREQQGCNNEGGLRRVAQYQKHLRRREHPYVYQHPEPENRGNGPGEDDQYTEAANKLFWRHKESAHIRGEMPQNRMISQSVYSISDQQYPAATEVSVINSAKAFYLQNGAQSN